MTKPTDPLRSALYDLLPDDVAALLGSRAAFRAYLVGAEARGVVAIVDAEHPGIGAVRCVVAKGG